MLKKDCFSPDETRQFAADLATRIPAGSVLGLKGPLGAGKTTFTQGLAEGLRIEDQVTSPTFTLINEYYGKGLPLYHFDCYRLAEAEEIETLGADDYFYGEGITVIEWFERVEEYLPENLIIAEFSVNPPDKRTIIVKGGPF